MVDTHGAKVIDPVWVLLDEAYQIHGIFPALLERDLNISPLAELVPGVSLLRCRKNGSRQDRVIHHG